MEACLTRGHAAACRRRTCSTAGCSHAILLEIFTDSGIGTMVIGAPVNDSPVHAKPARHSHSTQAASRATPCRQRFEAAMMPNYGTPPLALARGEGSRVWDADGNRYLDLIARHRGVRARPRAPGHRRRGDQRRSARSRTRSNLFVHEPGVAARRAAAQPAARRTARRVFFCNSGTEANEAALKLVRRQQGSDRPVIVAAEHSFHGRTMGALAHHRQGIDPRAVRAVRLRRPLGASTATSPPCGSAVDDRIAAVFLEPTQGEGGVLPAAARVPRRRPARPATTAGALLVLDEIQSGIGRTGAWFAHQAEGSCPDVLTLAKGLGGGLPIGACIGFGESRHRAAARATTAPPSAATRSPAPPRLAVLDTIEADGLLEQRQDGGRAPRERHRGASTTRCSAGVRGSGLWLAAMLDRGPGAAVNAAAPRRGLPGQRGRSRTRSGSPRR